VSREGDNLLFVFHKPPQWKRDNYVSFDGFWRMEDNSISPVSVCRDVFKRFFGVEIPTGEECFEYKNDRGRLKFICSWEPDRENTKTSEYW
jgi:hypothetical protein